MVLYGGSIGMGVPCVGFEFRVQGCWNDGFRAQVLDLGSKCTDTHLGPLKRFLGL